MVEKVQSPRPNHRQPTDRDLVKQEYNRRNLWGTDTILYYKNHPMQWSKVEGSHQNWEIDTSDLVPADAQSPDAEAAKLFSSDDVTVWFSRRHESMPYFFRNCDSDELHLISRGSMTYETDFGNIGVGERDFLLIPKGITYRVVMTEPRETLRVIYESGPEIFLIPAEMVDHVYHRGRPPVAEERLRRPVLRKTPPPTGAFQVRVKYSAAFAEFMGDSSTISYDRYPLDTELIDGNQPVVKFNMADIENFGGPPVPFIGGAYLDNKNNLAWALHMTGGGGRGAPVHRNPDTDELRYSPSGPMMGNFLFTPHGVDHGAGRGYTKMERNRPPTLYDQGEAITAYTLRPLKGTALAFQHARPGDC